MASMWQHSLLHAQTRRRAPSSRYKLGERAGWPGLGQELPWTLKEVFSFLKTGLKNLIWAERTVPGLMTSHLDMVESVGEWLRLGAPLSWWLSGALVLPPRKLQEVAWLSGNQGRQRDGGSSAPSLRGP